MSPRSSLHVSPSAGGGSPEAQNGTWRAAWQAWRARIEHSPSQTLYRVLWMGVGMFGVWQAALATLAVFHKGIGNYDEGVLLTGANQLLWGKLPYRDFYSNYPPGVFLLIAAGFKLAGVSVAVERTIGFALHLGVALGAGRVSGRLIGRRFSWVVAALVLTWLVRLGVVAYAWLAGLTIALFACELWAWAQVCRRAAAYGAVGVALGVLSWFRHDLFVYFVLTLSALGAIWLYRALRAGDRAPLRAMLWTGFGSVVAAGLMWVPVLALAGFERVSADLYFDQVRHTMPARVLPMPELFSMGSASWSPVELPAFLVNPFARAVFLTLLGPALAVAAFFLPRASGLKDRSLIVWPGALAFAVIPQMMGRTDIYHALFTITPGLMLSWFWLHGGAGRSFRAIAAWPAAILGAVLLYAPVHIWPAPAPVAAKPHSSGLARAGKTPVSRARKRALSFINEHTKAGDPIYVGLMDHRWTRKNDMDLYYLSDRVGATRYMQFDPNLANTERIQLQMIADLERVQPAIAILSTARQRGKEPNESQNKGSSLIDQYLRTHYRKTGRADRFVLAVRRPSAGEQAAR